MCACRLNCGLHPCCRGLQTVLWAAVLPHTTAVRFRRKSGAFAGPGLAAGIKRVLKLSDLDQLLGHLQAEAQQRLVEWAQW